MLAVNSSVKVAASEIAEHTRQSRHCHSTLLWRSSPALTGRFVTTVNEDGGQIEVGNRFAGGS